MTKENILKSNWKTSENKYNTPEQKEAIQHSAVVIETHEGPNRSQRRAQATANRKFLEKIQKKAMADHERKNKEIKEKLSQVQKDPKDSEK